MMAPLEFDLHCYSFIFVLITSLIPSQSQLCYPQYRCDPGYMDRTNGDPQTWACGVDCIGGRHLTDSLCSCACIPASTCAPSNPSVAPTMHPVTAKPTIDPTTVKPTTDPTTAKPTADPITAKPTTNPVTVQPTMGPVTVEPTIDPTTVKPTKNPTASPISVHSTMRADQMNENINIASMMSSATIVVSLIIAIVACVICLALLIIIYVIRKQALDANSQCINNINQQT
eukprot:459614_1